MQQVQTTLQVLIALIKKHGASLSAAKIKSVADASINCINPENLGVTDFGLDLLSELTKFNISKPQIMTAVDKIILLGSASYIKEENIERVQKFFTALTANVKDLDYASIVSNLYSLVTYDKILLPAKVIATIVTSNADLYKKNLAVFDSGLTSGSNEQKLKSAICIGELGKRKDLSSVPDLVKRLDKMFFDTDPQLRQAASHSLGSISIGNVGFFFPKVLELLRTDAANKYLLLVSVNDIILTNKGKELDNIEELLPILFENANSDEESIRNVVAECLGRLFIDNGTMMVIELPDKFNSPSKNMLTTIGKSLKHAITRTADLATISQIIPDFLDLCLHEDLSVRRYSLESIVSVAFNKPALLRSHMDKCIKILSTENKFSAATHIEEIDLGPFKHKVDIG